MTPPILRRRTAVTLPRLENVLEDDERAAANLTTVTRCTFMMVKREKSSKCGIRATRLKTGRVTAT